jgi:L-malate glycosyltransferase
MRIGFCLHAMHVAGAEVLVTQIIDRLRDQIEPTVFCLDGIGTLGEELRSGGVDVVLLGRKPGVDLALAKRYARELNDRKIALVHAHQYTPFFYTALARIRGASKTKILLTEHGRHFPDLVSAKRRWINRWLLARYADKATACCRFSADALRIKDGFPDVEVLYNGIDLADYPAALTADERAPFRQELKLRDDLKYIACIARFHPVKDHETLVRAFHIVTQNDPSIRLLLVGSGPEQPRIEQLCQSLEIQDKVEFCGVRRDVNKILRAADVFSLTSISEAASLTLLEAMASGCPVAITDVGGNGEHVRHGVDGWLSPRQDAHSLAANLLTILENPDNARAVARSARQRVETEFRLEQSVRRYEQHYKKLEVRS